MPPPEAQARVACAVITRDDRVLLVRRRHSEGTLSWQFPAGEVEPGEADEAAAVRETAEEVGLVVRGVRVLGDRTHPVTGRSMVYVSCEPISGEPYLADTDELAEFAWAALDELPTYVPHGLYQPVQEYLNQTLAA